MPRAADDAHNGNRNHWGKGKTLNPKPPCQGSMPRTVPPGVSYTPRDFMPTKRLSTMSTRPMPFSPAT